MTETIAHVVPLWVRILFGVMCLMVLGLTVPAFFDATANPGLADLPPEFATNGSVAGGFLARQFAIAVVGLYAVWKASPAMLVVAAGAFFIWNLLEGIFQLTAGSFQGGAAGLAFAALSGVVILAAIRPKEGIG